MFPLPLFKTEWGGLESEDSNGEKIMVPKESKLFILQEIEKRKGILFGVFSEKLKKQDKVAM
jgi:hypothetical protein